MSCHKPGPFTVGPTFEGRVKLRDADHQVLCELWADDAATNRLLAAAPDILAALEALLEETDDHARCASNGTGHFLSRATRRQVAEAIANARGIEDR